MQRRADLEKKLQFYYEREKAGDNIDTTANDNPTIHELWEKQYDVTRYFTRDFMPTPWTPRTGLAGKAAITFKRFFRKGTVYIFEQFSAFLYQFESRLLELLGMFIQTFASFDGRMSKTEIQAKEQIEQISRQQERLQELEKEVIKNKKWFVQQLEEKNSLISSQRNQIMEQQKQIEAQEQFSKNQTDQISSLNLHFTMAQKGFQQTDDLRRKHIAQLEVQLQSAQLQVIQLMNMLIEPSADKKTAEQNFENVLPVQYIGRNDGFYSYSQCGEDGILNYLLFIMQRRDPKTIRYLDIGCNDFRCDNNTYFLYQRGASGVDIDANPLCVESVKKNRVRDTVINAGVGAETAEALPFYIMSNYGLSSFSKDSIEEAIAKNSENRIDQVIDVPVIGINSLMKEYFSDSPPTVLSIDAEGLDIQILGALDFNLYRPAIIIVESIDYVPWIALEKSRNEIGEILKSKGYVEYAFTGVNSIFLDPWITQ